MSFWAKKGACGKPPSEENCEKHQNRLKMGRLQSFWDVSYTKNAQFFEPDSHVNAVLRLDLKNEGLRAIFLTFFFSCYFFMEIK